MAKSRPVPAPARAMGVQARPAGFVGPMPAEPARRARASGGRVRQGIANAYPEPIGPSLPETNDRILKGRSGAQRKDAKMGGLRNPSLSGLRKLGMLAGGAGLASAGLSMAYGMNRDAMIRDAIRDLTKRQEDLKVAEARRQGQEASYESAINMNLQRLARSAPELYASVAAGRKLPQGGVVIGGAPRQDLLNELGRAMSDGRFSR